MVCKTKTRRPMTVVYLESFNMDCRVTFLSVHFQCCKVTNSSLTEDISHQPGLLSFFLFLTHLPPVPFPLFTLSSHSIHVFYHNSDPQKGILTRYQNKNLYLIWEQLHSEVGCAGLLSAERVFFIKQVIRR